MNNARALLLRQSFGILSTMSLDVPGYPFGSVTPYCVDDQCRPILYISRIAQHTKNILADPRVSLTIVENDESTDDVQARGRVTFVANAKVLDPSESDVGERYFRYFPSSRAYDRTHDFEFFRLEPVRVRFIGGFGQIFWVEPAEFLTKNPFSAFQEEMMIEHMNRDHSEALQRYGGKPAVMIGIDSEGLDVLSAGRKVRFPFEKPISNMEEARLTLAAMAH